MTRKRKGLVALDILFVNTGHLGGKFVDALTHGWEHVAFYNVFKPSKNKKGVIAEAVLPELGLFPLNKYDAYTEKEVVRLWVTPQQREAVEQYIKEILATDPKYSVLDCITTGIRVMFGIDLPDITPNTRMCSYFVTDGLRRVFPTLCPGIRPNNVDPSELYGGLRMLAHDQAQEGGCLV